MAHSIMDSSDIVESLADFESLDSGFTIQAELDMLNEANKHKVIMSSDHMDIITDIIPKEELNVKPIDPMEEDAAIEQAITEEIMDDTISNEMMQNVMHIEDRMDQPIYSDNIIEQVIDEKNDSVSEKTDSPSVDAETESKDYTLMDVNDVAEETVIESGQVEDKTVEDPSPQIEQPIPVSEAKTESTEPTQKIVTSYMVTPTGNISSFKGGSFLNRDSKITRLTLPSTAIDSSSGQTIRIVNPGKGFGGGKTITLGQAKKMGLLTQSKINHILPNTSKQGLNKIVIPSNKTVTVVKSPTKILPAPPATSTMAPRTQKVLIRQANSFKPGTIITGGMSGQMIRIPTNQHIQIPGASGKPVQYVKLISNSKGQTLLPVSLSKSVPISLSQSIMTAPSSAYKVVPISAPSSVTTTNQQKLYIPASAVSSNSTASNTNQQLNSIVMVPSNLLQVKKQLKEVQPAIPAVKPKEPSPPPPPVSLSPTTISAGALPVINKVPQAPDSVSENWSDEECVLEVNGIRPRKPCNCTKSMCLKLYCDCFANGEFCNNCNCTTCYNNLSHEEERQQAIKACLERNPAAFRPKIGKTFTGSDERRHNKGCNCKRSGCLKNYCECFEAKIPCSKNCRCVQCKNVEGLLGKRGADERLRKSDIISKAQFATGARYRQAFNLMTPEVIQATCQCLIAQAEKWDSVGEEMEGTIRYATQSHVIQEFGRCVVQLIECVAKSMPPQHATS